MINLLKLTTYLSVIFLLTACAKTVVDYTPSPKLNTDVTWAVLPFTNHTEVPLAGDRAASISAELLRAQYQFDVLVYQQEASEDMILADININSEQALTWAEQNAATYLLTGDVNEWRYKVGLDGEPVVGVTLQLWDVNNQQVIWSAVGSRSDGSRVALSTAAQILLNRMIKGLN